jgi:large subunit ribosomal protein L23
MDLHPFEIIRRPVVTESSTFLQDSGRYTFEVAVSATKHQVKEAVEEAFNVEVLKVNTMMVKGKRKRLGPRFTMSKSWKKAIVQLAPGNSITIFEGV